MSVNIRAMIKKNPKSQCIKLTFRSIRVMNGCLNVEKKILHIFLHEIDSDDGTRRKIFDLIFILQIERFERYTQKNFKNGKETI